MAKEPTPPPREASELGKGTPPKTLIDIKPPPPPAPPPKKPE